MTHGDTHADIGNAVRKQNHAPGLCTACFAGVLYRENVYNVVLHKPTPKSQKDSLYDMQFSSRAWSAWSRNQENIWHYQNASS